MVFDIDLFIFKRNINISILIEIPTGTLKHFHNIRNFGVIKLHEYKFKIFFSKLIYPKPIFTTSIELTYL